NVITSTENVGVLTKDFSLEDLLLFVSLIARPIHSKSWAQCHQGHFVLAAHRLLISEGTSLKVVCQASSRRLHVAITSRALLCRREVRFSERHINVSLVR